MAPDRRSRPWASPWGPVRLAAAGAVLALAALAAAAPAEAKVFMNLDQALELAFADPASAVRKTAYLTEEQAERVTAQAGSEPTTRVVVYYVGTARDGGKVTAYFDTHMVRTLPETVMIVVDGSASVRRVDILSFDEPEDYLPSRCWLDQFNGRPLDDELSTRKAIRAVTGATMSSRAVTATVRRALAVHAILHEAKDGAGDGASGEERP